jgi:hypothetical protein
VGIKTLNHSFDGPLNELLRVLRFDVALFDLTKNFREKLNIFIDFPCSSRNGPRIPVKKEYHPYHKGQKKELHQ